MDILNNLLNSRKKKIIFGIIVLCIIALIIFLATRKTPFEDTGRLVTPEPTIVAIENNTAVLKRVIIQRKYRSQMKIVFQK